MKQPRHPEPAEITLTRVLSALGDPVRLGVVTLLADGGERGWGELRAPVAKSTLSHHLKVLRDAGITWTRQEGTRCYVRLRRDDLDRLFPGVLGALLEAAATAGDAVAVTLGIDTA
ncbi:ArsR/SmtB family transcription factor [Actinophytocola algeriensis]|uniref:DNA-binding transcriptional ArsR family regulator n=1 Tax=Actinophytocola algeriensis TaxID=1768010 RepID=A0A7W7Q9T0_9PSEU|nr:metalloregulator ArsR/SmtB family transcription factor [Actinophytocola algeriensis]MBB4909304.1 DNA-binding transcriptional ArsR family regulator [Actinophytocola algeriensis]MBE1475294.1 DNA-binding transcriptional ArsR family regulator [Actinophytocola algeriensis]